MTCTSVLDDAKGAPEHMAIEPVGGAPTSAARVPILMYHEVLAEEQLRDLAGRIHSSYVITDTQFSLHLELIRELGLQIIGLDRFIAWRDGKSDLPDNAVIISFDDGYSGNFQHALPLLQEFGSSGTFFVVSRKIGDPGMMSWAQLRAMGDAGMLVESHTATHPLLSQLDEKATREELEQSKHEIQSRTGRAVTMISLPNGDVNPWYKRIALDLGYAGGCCSAIGLNSASTDRFMLKRIPIKRGLTQAQLRGYLSGSTVTYAAAKVQSMAKGALVGALGKGNYDKVYNRFFGVQDQRKRGS